MRRFLLLVLLFCSTHYNSLSQFATDTTGSKSDSAKSILVDSTKATIKASNKNIKSDVIIKKGFQPTKTPMVALGLSTLLPGAGQIYDESYWKVPILWGLGGYWVYEYIQNNNNYKSYRDQYLQSLIDIPGYGDARLQRLRDFYRGERDKFGWYIGVLYLANIIDAYISAHLYDFDVTPDLGEQGQVGMKLKLKL
ncbi:MAG: DUF5683 domain-containing protein [Bacteroidota bacterium]